MDNSPCRNEGITDATWNLHDLLIVCGVALFGGCLIAIALLLFLGPSDVIVGIARCLIGASVTFWLILWLKKKRAVPISALGLKRGRLSVLAAIAIGVGVAVIWTFLLDFVVLRVRMSVFCDMVIYRHFNYLFLLVTFNGFASLVVTPISEEILFRGFIYGYLRKKVGIAIGLLIQAFVFGIVHAITPHGISDILILVVNGVIMGLILGLLYEKTSSLLSSLVCHSVFNYLSWLVIFLTRMR
jgi:membrane protease YdiL (CAAX protease family)